MAHRKYDRVQETSTSTGATTMALAGAVTRMRRFGDVLSNADTCYVLIEHATAAEWQICLATWNTGHSLTLGTVLTSSTGSAVTFSAGTKTISLIAPAAKSIVEDNNGDVAITRNLTVAGITATGVTTAGLLNTGATVNQNVVDDAAGVDFASASTINMANATGNSLRVTGTTTITSLGTVQAGAIRILTFAAALTLTHHATSLILPAGANILTAAGDVAVFQSLGSGNWRCADYTRADGTSLVPLRSKVISMTRAAAAAAGSVGYTGVGFKPTAVILWGGQFTSSNIGLAFADQSGTIGAMGDAAAWVQTNVMLFGALAAYQYATVASYDSDGFTLAWNKVGAPAGGDFTIYALCLR